MVTNDIDWLAHGQKRHPDSVWCPEKCKRYIALVSLSLDRLALGSNNIRMRVDPTILLILVITEQCHYHCSSIAILWLSRIVTQPLKYWIFCIYVFIVESFIIKLNFILCDVILIWFDLIWFDLIWFDLIWFDLIWFDLRTGVRVCLVFFSVECGNTGLEYYWLV